MATTRISGRQARLPRRLQPRRAPRQSRSQFTVEAVLEAASRILVEKRWSRMSMQDVAKTAGISPGTLYQYFPDKAALIAELVERISQREVAFQTERFERLAAGPDLEPLLEQMILGTLEFQRREGELMRAALEAMPHLGRHQLLVERVQAVSQMLSQVLELHKDRLPHGDIALITHVLVNALHSLTHDGVLPRPPALDDATLAREALALVRGYLTAPR
jgi:AcrR family transcriptional regulator